MASTERLRIAVKNVRTNVRPSQIYKVEAENGLQASAPLQLSKLSRRRRVRL
jgi:hypothetical protein